MTIYKIKNDKLTLIKDKKIELEKHIQEIIEANLQVVFGLKFIVSEFKIQNFRIDTLAYDENSKSFIIIEYKRNTSFSVIDQGFSYLSLMLNNKDSFILEFAKKTSIDINKINIDWSQSKVVFIARKFNTYQQNAINFKDLPIELWEVNKYENELLSFNKLRSMNGSESINKVSKNKYIESVSKEVRKHTVDEHFNEDWISKEIFEVLRERIFSLDSNNIEEVPTKVYIGYKLGTSVLFALITRKTRIEVHLNRITPKDLKDPQKALSYIDNSKKYWNKHVSKFQIKSIDDIEYAMYLIRQVYDKYNN